MSKEQFEAHQAEQLAKLSPEERQKMEEDMAFIAEDKLRSDAEDLAEELGDDENY